MNLPDMPGYLWTTLSTFSFLDGGVYLLAAMFTFYPFRISPEGAALVASPLGIGLLGLGTVYMLLCCKVITGVAFMYVAYCFLQLCLASAPLESAQTGPVRSAFNAAVTSAAARPQEMTQTKVDFEPTLEEAVVRALAPIGVGPPVVADEKAKWSPVSADHKYGAPI